MWGRVRDRRAVPSREGPRLTPVAGRTQDALYSEIDLDLSWSEGELPQAQRTKHVHSLHPYLGKYVPQLVEIFLSRYFRPGQCVYDPFVGSGTTLVEANVQGLDAVGCDVSVFNCLLSRVKTTRYPMGAVELALKGVVEEVRRHGPAETVSASDWLRSWYAPRALGELLRYRELSAARLDHPTSEVAKVIVSRAARSARLTPHFDLDFPREPVAEPYFCHKHKRTCRPVRESMKFLSRYTMDTVLRLRTFSSIQKPRFVHVLHADARLVQLPVQPQGVITSPPYPGLIDYHEQHRYAYELLQLEDQRSKEIGAAAFGTGRAALSRYVEAMATVFANAARQLPMDAPVIIVVNDSRNLYPDILRHSGLRLEAESKRHVNRRTGRRAGEYFESVLVCRVTRS